MLSVLRGYGRRGAGNGYSAWAIVLMSVVFTGKNTGEFSALDADTGEVVWSFKTGSGINAQPVTWTKNGKQYVTILSGLGGVGSSRRALSSPIPLGGSVWTFAPCHGRACAARKWPSI